MANKRIDQHDTITPDGSEFLLTQDSTTLEYNKATISSAVNATSYTKIEVDTSLAGKAELVHVHAISDVTGLQTALDGKVGKVTTVNTLYGVNGTGGQTSYLISQSSATSSIAQRSSGGTLAVGTPTASAHATTKAYVDAADTAHTSNTSNPHSVTKAQVGLGNVENLAPADMPVSTAQQTALDDKQDVLVSGTNIKTINGTTLLGSGDITISGGGGGAVDSVNGQTGVVVLDADDIDDASTSHKFVTASDITKLSNLSGTNTGDQDLSSYATTAALAAKENIAKVTPIAVSTSTSAGTAAKVATTTGGTYTPTEGDIICVTFTAANTATNPTINIDGSGAKSILLGNVNPTAVAMAGTKVMMWYDGTAFQLFGSQRVSDTSTTYSEISEAEITAGSASTARSITGRRSKFIIDTAVGNVAAATQTLTNKTISGSNNTLSDIAQTSVTNLTSDLAGKASSTHTHAIDDLSDVTISAPSTGQVIKYNGSAWVNDTDATSGGAGATNLSTTLSSTQTVIASDTGTDATIPAVDGTNAGVMTPTMKSKLDGIATGATANDTDANLKARANHTGTQSADTITDGTTNKAYTATEKTKLAGIATGANVGVVPNSAITGATKTKVTYDAKGLVTAGADATTADIADSLNKRYVTDAQLTVIGNTSGTNSGNVSITGEDYLSLTGQAITANAIDLDNLSATGTPSATTFLRGDNTWAIPAGGGTGDVVGPASAVDSRVAMFNGTTGKLIKDSGLTLSGTNTGDQTNITGNAGTATALQTSRNFITNLANNAGQYFDGTADMAPGVTGRLAAANGGTGNGFTKFTGPATSEKTFTLPNANATILTSNAAVTVAQGGTGATTLTGILKGNGTSAVTAVTAPTGDIVGTTDTQTLTNKTLTTPTISSTGFTNAQHAHAGATSGGQIPIANTTGTLAVGRGGTGATTLTGILKGNGTSAVTAVTAPTGDIVGTTDTQTLTNKTLTAPKLGSGGFIADANGNEVIKTATTVASAVNEITVSNAATGGTPIIEATGGDANVHLVVRAKGNGLTKVSVLRQDDTTNSYKHNSVMLTGWGVITGTSGTANYNETVNFGVTFAQRPIVLATAGGDAVTATGAAYGNGTNAIAADWLCKAVSITTTGFTVFLRTTNFSANGFVFYQWLAIGEL